MIDSTIINVSPLQVLAMSKIFIGKLARGRALTPTRNFQIEQTWTDSGGTHLYVTHGGDKFHISARGRTVKLDS